MAKVICFYTREEITALPHTKQDGDAMIENLLRLDMQRSKRQGVPDAGLIEALISIVENNTGASRYEVMDRIYGKRKV